MSASDITLQHPNVNGGTAVQCNGATIRYAWKNLIRADPVEGKHDICEVEYAGFENPKIILTGTIDVDDTSSNVITQSLLLDFAQACDGTNSITLTVKAAGESGTGTYLKGRPTAGYSVGGTYTNSLKVVFETISINFGVPESKEGKIWNYQVTMVETA